MNNKNADLWVIGGASLAVVLIFIKCAGWIASAINLDLDSASCILGGVLLVFALFGCVVYFGWNMLGLAPWILWVFALFWIPALRYWASAGPGPFHFETTEQNIAWFGNPWGLLFIVLALALGAYMCNKLTDNTWRDW